MTETERETESFNLGKVVVQAFDGIEAQAGRLLGLALLLLAVPLFAINLWQHSAVAATVMRDPQRADLITAAAFAARIVFGSITQAMLVEAMMRRAAGARIGFFATLSAIPRAGPPALAIWFVLTVVVGLVSGIAGMLTGLIVRPSMGTLSSFLFLIPAMPGVWIWMRWSVAIPAFVDEPRGILPTLGRSVALTRQARGAIFWACMVLEFLELVLSYFLVHLADTPYLWALVASAGGMVMSILTAALSVSTYLALRGISDGGDLERVFA